MILATVASASGSAAASGVQAGRTKLEARFAALLEGAEVDVEIMDKFGDMGLKKLSMFTSLGKDEDRLRAFLKKAPLLLDEETDIPTALKIAKLVSVWECAKTTVHVENEAQAQRQSQGLPPKTGDKEVATLRCIFEARHFPLTEVMVPSDGYFERKIGELEKVWEAEPLSDVTNKCQRDVNRNAGVAWDNGTNQFKTVEKRFGVPMPEDSEGLTTRLRTMGVTWQMLKFRNPNCPVLATASYEIFDRYSEWLKGPEVWGLATKDKSQRPVATPCLDHVLAYDYEIRKKVALHMNQGIDIRSAFGLATSDDKLQRTAFLNYVTLEIATGKCKAITAPGMKEVHAGVSTYSEPPQGHKRNYDEMSEGLSKSQLNKIKQQAKKQALADAKRQYAALAPPPGNFGPPRPPGQGLSKAAKKRANAAANGAAGYPRAQAAIQAPPAQFALLNGGKGDGSQKGAGKGGKGAKGACYAWNDGNPCKQGAQCPFAHVCSKCGGPHKRGACGGA